MHACSPNGYINWTGYGATGEGRLADYMLRAKPYVHIYLAIQLYRCFYPDQCGSALRAANRGLFSRTDMRSL